MLRRLATNPQGAICLVVLLIVVVVGIFAPLIAPFGPNTLDLNFINAAPFTPGHLFGGDKSGRDIFSRSMWGTRQTLIACVIVAVVSRRHRRHQRPDRRLLPRPVAKPSPTSYRTRSCRLPGIVLLIALYSLTGPNIVAAMTTFGVIVAPSYFRLVRSIVVGVRTELYIDAAKVVGLSDLRIVGRHVLWAVRAPVIIQTSFVLAAGIGIEAGVGFLGPRGPATASWGSVLQDSFNNIYNNRSAVVWPALLISLTILVLILLGNSLRDVLQSTVQAKRLTRRAVGGSSTGHWRRIRRLASAPGSAPNDALLQIRGLRVGYPERAGGVR